MTTMITMLHIIVATVRTKESHHRKRRLKFVFKMSETAKTRSSKFSSTQKEAMVDFMELNPQLRGGKFTKEFTLKMAEQLWRNLTDFLNSLPGCEKDINQWRKTWQDLKATVKSKSSENNIDSNKTGGGRSTGVPLSALEERVKSLIGVTTINGNSAIPESAVNMNWGPSPINNSAQKSVNDQIPPINIPAIKRINDQIRLMEEECSQTTSNQNPPTATITAPPSPINTTPSPASIRSTTFNLNSPSTNDQQQDTSRVRHMSTSQVQADPTINYLRNISTISEQISPIRQRSSSQAASVNDTQTGNGSHSSQNNNTPRLSTNSNRPYSRQRPSPTSSNSNLNMFFNDRPRSSRGRTQQNRPRRIATQRFENTIDAAETLIQALRKKTEVKENYYKNKLALMEANVKAQEGIATALLDIAAAMKQN